MEDENLTHHAQVNQVFLAISGHVIVTVQILVLFAFFCPGVKLEIIFESIL